MKTDFPDLNTADLTEALERRRITLPEAKLEALLKKTNQKKVKAAVSEVADFSGKISVAYDEVLRQLDEKELI
jgi:hypothetical protein